uniref:hypothetical protein n=1 Tax=Streptomyces sp. NRRL B-24085 TaxID=1709476 RepID=UPI0006B3495A
MPSPEPPYPKGTQDQVPARQHTPTSAAGTSIHRDHHATDTPPRVRKVTGYHVHAADRGTEGTTHTV